MSFLKFLKQKGRSKDMGECLDHTPTEASATGTSRGAYTATRHHHQTQQHSAGVNHETATYKETTKRVGNYNSNSSNSNQSTGIGSRGTTHSGVTGRYTTHAPSPKISSTTGQTQQPKTTQASDTRVSASISGVVEHDARAKSEGCQAKSALNNPDMSAEISEADRRKARQLSISRSGRYKARKRERSGFLDKPELFAGSKDSPSSPSSCSSMSSSEPSSPSSPLSPVAGAATATTQSQSAMSSPISSSSSVTTSQSSSSPSTSTTTTSPKSKPGHSRNSSNPSSCRERNEKIPSLRLKHGPNINSQVTMV